MVGTPYSRLKRTKSHTLFKVGNMFFFLIWHLVYQIYKAGKTASASLWTQLHHVIFYFISVRKKEYCLQIRWDAGHNGTTKLIQRTLGNNYKIHAK